VKIILCEVKSTIKEVIPEANSIGPDLEDYIGEKLNFS
jgi:hypothetical protein